MFRNRLDVHVRALIKKPVAAPMNDNGEPSETYPNMWAVLVDMGYVGLAQSVRAVHPKKESVHGTLDRQDLDRNTKVSSDRAIVENFFGRVCLLWKISYGTYAWDSKFYDGIQRLTFALPCWTDVPSR
ncbi:hypothetical protein H257_00309 [Aphanomyces astaci]|uniref:DDE Tnp4 domain-containing protein n=1 Tax=Aphanomyces astaci TaxID=112090 RepID=W4HA58_APHAT|nr:hypothetical protein H257_00309 [Aphanomyces astaci]ETV88817.1 hypothetical protein H257_00309 [Aphanomyces astaci]|eukprot:XP_009821217.1 hypothetical protein H257_00309 [Aphanomyces astaci]